MLFVVYYFYLRKLLVMQERKHKLLIVVQLKLMEVEIKVQLVVHHQLKSSGKYSVEDGSTAKGVKRTATRVSTANAKSSVGTSKIFLGTSSKKGPSTLQRLQSNVSRVTSKVGVSVAPAMDDPKDRRRTGCGCRLKHHLQEIRDQSYSI